MIEQFIFDKVTSDPTLQTLLFAGTGKYHLYPAVIPRGISFDKAATFTKIITNDAFPAIQSVDIQFNIFAKSHADTVAISKALSDLFNDNRNQTSGGVSVYYSIRSSESDLGYDFDEKLYQRESTYNYKLR